VSVGTNPTFHGTGRRVEAYAIDERGLDLYGRVMALDFAARLRPMVTFDSIDALTAQMADDVERCRALLSPAPAEGS
jgi:riboflavin kinase / FMN adenylyltransferase